MSLQRLDAHSLLEQLDRFDALIDARSEGEYALDRLPGALNWPSLTDVQRHQVGSTYKQISAFEARKRGAAMVAHNIARHIEREVLDKPKGWQPLLYCWRGGQRSGALALVLEQIGFKVTLLEGGYKAWRNALRADLPPQVARLRWQVVCGPTGSGKTRLLQHLTQAGAQVLDLEALACHRSSVLGMLPGQAQPGQKQFESRLWDALRRMDSARPVFVESESKKVGNLCVPDALIAAMRSSPCVDLQLPTAHRIRLLVQEYAFLASDTGTLCQQLALLVSLRGHAVVNRWTALARSGQIDTLVQDLLDTHYDPGYQQSMVRNFSRFGQARPFALPDYSEQTFAAAAARLVQDTQELSGGSCGAGVGST